MMTMTTPKLNGPAVRLMQYDLRICTSCPVQGDLGTCDCERNEMAETNASQGIMGLDQLALLKFVHRQSITTRGEDRQGQVERG